VSPLVAVLDEAPIIFIGLDFWICLAMFLLIISPKYKMQLSISDYRAAEKETVNWPKAAKFPDQTCLT
jgi:hypothetical protein